MTELRLIQRETQWHRSEFCETKYTPLLRASQTRREVGCGCACDTLSGELMGGKSVSECGREKALAGAIHAWFFGVF